jgi:hypothetical protein
MFPNLHGTCGNNPSLTGFDGRSRIYAQIRTPTGDATAHTDRINLSTTGCVPLTRRFGVCSDGHTRENALVLV